MDKRQIYSVAEAKEECLKYFDGDQMAADTMINKYLLRNRKGELLEKNPNQLIDRCADEFHRIEMKYSEPASKEEIRKALDGFKRIVPQGSPLSGIGNNEQVVSISNCFVIGQPLDSWGGICRKDEELAQIEKRRGGVGIDLSTLRPAKSMVHNAAVTSDGVVCFAQKYSNTSEGVAQGGRRGALMLSLSCRHPDIEQFIECKRDLKKVNGANISVKWTDDFLQAVQDDKDYILRFPVDADPADAVMTETVKARKVWDKFVEAAHASGEPGCLFWDNMAKGSISDCYDNERHIVTTNPCVSKNTWIMTTEGPRQVIDLLGVPFTAIVHGKPYQCQSGFFKTGDKELFELKTDRGYSAELTSNHLIDIENKDGDGRCWKTVADVELGDDWVLQRHSEVEWGGPGVFQEGWLMGFLLGDGNMEIEDESAMLQFYGRKKELFPIAVEYTKDCVEVRSDFGSGGVIKDRDVMTFSSTELFKLANTFGIRKDKSLSLEFEKTSSAFYKGVLAGWFDADGSVQGSVEKGRSLRITSINREHLQVYQRMLSRLGILSTVYEKRKTKGTKMMPDGNGGLKEYECQDLHELVIGRENITTFKERIFFHHPDKIQALNDMLSSNKRDMYADRGSATIKSIDSKGVHEVYDCTIEEIHSFDGNGLTMHNCGEIPLPPMGACVLMLLNLTGYVKNPYSDKSDFDYKLFAKDVKLATRLIDDLVDLEIEKVKAIIAKIKVDTEPDEIKHVELNVWKNILKRHEDDRRVGLGVTGLADCLAMLGVRYGSAESLKTIETIFKEFNTQNMAEEYILAKERGSFKGWNYDLEKDNRHISVLPDDIKAEIKKHGRRNISTSTCSPAGTVSIITRTSSGIEPVFEVEYVRRSKMTAEEEACGVKPSNVDVSGIKWKEYTVVHCGQQEWKKLNPGKKPDESPYHGCDARRLEWKGRVKTQSTIQKYISSSISSTINMPKTSTVKDVNDAYMMAWKEGCKGITVYRDGSRENILSTGGKVDDIIETSAPKRPNTLICDIHYSTIDKSNWMFFVGLLNGRPYDIFGGKKNNVEIPKKFKTGWIKKNGKNDRGFSTYDLYLGSLEESEDRMIIHDIASVFQPDTGSYTRMISAMLRHGIPIKFICEQLHKDSEETSMFTFEKGVARVLKKYIKDGEKAVGVCLSCKSANLQYRDGCVFCADCGYSKCS